MMMKKLVVIAAALFASTSAFAATVDATHTTTGSAGAWVYDFTFTNNIPNADQKLYFVGVSDDQGVITGSASGFTPYPGGFTVNNDFYNLAWIVNGFDIAGLGIAPGESRSGFTILDTAATAKTSFNFFGYTYGDSSYNGPDNVGGYGPRNPGFTGVSISATGAVPEPATWAMMIGGMGVVGGAMRRRKVSTKVSFA